MMRYGTEADRMQSNPQPINRLQKWLKIDPAAKPDIYTHVYATAALSNLSYWLQILFSAGIATLGLVLNSPAVIIGGMLISPLMEPIMATGMGLATGDLYLVFKAILKLIVSVLLAVLLSTLLVWILPFHSPTAEILARVNPTLLDLGIALLSGLAGSFAVSRAGGADGVMTLPGVAIAVALMPPLCTVGFGVGSGFKHGIMGGAGLLFLTNLVAIVFSAFGVFLLVGMDTPAVRAAVAKCHADEPVAHRIEKGPLRLAFRNGGQLRWRVLVLLALLGAVAFPLQKALKQVAGEAVARDAVQQVVHRLVPAQALVAQQTEVGRQTISVRLISTQVIPEAKRAAAEAEITRRSGRAAELTVQSVASQSELSQLAQQIAASSAAPPAPPPPPPPDTLAQMQASLLARIQPVVQSVWPPETPLVDFNISVADDSAAALTLNAHYTADKDLPPVAIGLITRELQTRLSAPKLVLHAQRQAPPTPARAPHHKR
jgi:uncharacterized hydrophobic protein (TIGR00271 family)